MKVDVVMMDGEKYEEKNKTKILKENLNKK